MTPNPLLEADYADLGERPEIPAKVVFALRVAELERRAVS